ncbi:site-specific integrase [Streptomyces phaeolivaceus]|uniref:site-specific integrase n=1 Tax=Streptomyces phaeolivaceus TaxID=2653200 RepID=UPI001D04BF0F|nr:site-specific integrase [Streptomyces phaeolivaceus]
MSALGGWEDLEERETRAGIRPGTPILLSPNCQVDGRLSQFLARSSFSRLEPESKRNYTTDYCVFFDFLWVRGKNWDEATSSDLWDFEDWRTRSIRNPEKVGGARWNRGLAALGRLYSWAVKQQYVSVSPIETREAIGRHGQIVEVPAARAKDARSSNVRWLTPRTFRRWVDVGLRGFSADGVPDAAWAGRLADRNSAFANLLFSSGVRLTEGASLLTLEIPNLTMDERRYYASRLAPVVTKSKRARTFYVASPVVGEIETYCESTRAASIRRAQRQGRYERLPQLRLVTSVSGHRMKVLHWRDRDGTVGKTALAQAGVEERALLFTEGPDGPEPLWVWLNESGLPFQPSSWEGIFRTATDRCQKVLAKTIAEPPFCTPHMCRHSFALYMLVVLHHVMDVRLGLTPQERRDFLLLYGDPWRMVQDLLGHADVETTRKIYLAPVSDLQLHSLIATPGRASDDSTDSAVDDVSWILAQLAAETSRIQDLRDDWAVL